MFGAYDAVRLMVAEVVPPHLAPFSSSGLLTRVMTPCDENSSLASMLGR